MNLGGFSAVDLENIARDEAERGCEGHSVPMAMDTPSCSRCVIRAMARAVNVYRAYVAGQLRQMRKDVQGKRCENSLRALLAALETDIQPEGGVRQP